MIKRWWIRTLTILSLLKRHVQTGFEALLSALIVGGFVAVWGWTIIMSKIFDFLHFITWNLEHKDIEKFISNNF